MEMCYDGTPVMPSNYAVMDEEEMRYVDGGWDYKYTKKNIEVPILKRYLSRTVCLAFANHVIMKHGNGILVNGMGRIRVASELFAHAVGYYSATLLKKAGIKADIINDIRTCGRKADIGWGDGLAFAYSLIWKCGSI